MNAAFEYCMITSETPHAVTRTATTTVTTMPRFGFLPCSDISTPFPRASRHTDRAFARIRTIWPSSKS